MARKKAKKITNTKKTAVKSQPKKAANHLANTLEKDFRDIPAKLIAQLRKEVATLAQQEKKLKVELKKADAQKKASKTKHAALTLKAKKKPSATSKKLMNLAKMTHDKTLKTIQDLTKQLDQIKAETKTVATKQAKFAAIATQLNQFEKQWALKAKKATKIAPKARKKTTRKQKTASDAATPSHENASFNLSASSETSEPVTE
ncbi:MAG: hypothetical protein P4M14_04775 [Gammaproteobacteria bacterium]|nr:hypothetical protein [Gammaproteobacteria bacterium]